MNEFIFPYARFALSLRFAGIIQRACEKTGECVVILVDEYDKPILQAINNEELYLQNAFYLIMTMMGFYSDVERTTSEGRIDMTVETKDYIYLFEFKLDRTPEEALQQIEDNGYAKPFAMDSRKLFRVGVNFSSEMRCIDGWKIEE
jgi:hypothetical protein